MLWHLQPCTPTSGQAAEVRAVVRELETRLRSQVEAAAKDVLERLTTMGGAPLPTPRTPRTPDQSDKSGKKRNLPLGKSCRAIFGTQYFGSQTPPPFLYSKASLATAELGIEVVVELEILEVQAEVQAQVQAEVQEVEGQIAVRLGEELELDLKYRWRWR